MTSPRIRAGFDTETTGLDHFHGDLPFMCCFKFNQPMPELNGHSEVTWEWPINPLTRIPQYDLQDLTEIVQWLQRTDIEWFLHNAKFDVRSIEMAIKSWITEASKTWHDLDIDTHPSIEFIRSFNPYEFLERANDTALMAHALDNRGSHGLKDLGVRFLSIPEDDVDALKAQVEACYPLAEALGWKVANNQNCPLVMKKPNTGWWVMDMWLPAACWNYIKSLPGGQTSQTVSDLYYLLWNPKDETFNNLCNRYCLTDCLRTLMLGEFLSTTLTQENLTESYEVSRCQLPVAYRMEEHGLPVLMDRLIEEQTRLRALSKQCEAICKQLILDPFINLNAPQQVATAISVNFNVTIQRQTKNGESTIDKDEVEELMADIDARIQQGEHQLSPLYNFLFYYTGYKKCSKIADQDIPRYKRNVICEDVKLNGFDTYIKSWRIHFNFNPCGADTGRYSSDGSQNIGKGKNAFNEGIKQLDLSLRKIFGPDPGRKWYSIDGKQLQVVIAAYTSGEPLLMQAVQKGQDLHEIVHLRLADRLGWVYNKDDEGQRTIAKNCNFGYLFGAGDAKINDTSHTTGIYPILKELFPEAHKRIRADIRQAKDTGHIYAGPVRLQPPPATPYAATVYKIQGLEAVIMKRAMRNIYLFLKANPQYDATLILMVHDEVDIDVPLEDDPNLLSYLIYFVEEAGRFYGVPCRADAKVITTNWKDGKKVVLCQQ